MRIAFACPIVGVRPHKPFIDALEATLPVLDKAGIEHKFVSEPNNPYISNARAAMARKALDWLRDDTDQIIFLDYDVAWQPHDMLKLVYGMGDVVCGTYRFKKIRPEDSPGWLTDENGWPEEYMGRWETFENGYPIRRIEDGALSAIMAPAGFLRVNLRAVDLFCSAFPQLMVGPHYRPTIDLFNHGAHERVWWGEDYAFIRRWRETGNRAWMLPTLQLDHWSRVTDEHGDPIYKDRPDGTREYQWKAWRGNLQAYIAKKWPPMEIPAAIQEFVGKPNGAASPSDVSSPQPKPLEAQPHE